MNLVHQRLCSSQRWLRTVQDLVPWALDGIELGDAVLEIGPGYGATTRVLRERVAGLTVVEVDPTLAGRLRRELDDVEVIDGDGSAMPLPDGRFSAVVCFTMLHHVPTAAIQDRLFAEAHRVLRPGGVFAGSDSLLSPRFRLLHVFDTMTVVAPATLPDRLRAAGFIDAHVDVRPRRRLRFRASKPA